MAAKQRNAPTSLTLRDQSCAQAHYRSRDECRVIHVALGYPQRGLGRALTLDQHPAWSIPLPDG